MWIVNRTGNVCHKFTLPEEIGANLFDPIRYAQRRIFPPCRPPDSLEVPLQDSLAHLRTASLSRPLLNTIRGLAEPVGPPDSRSRGSPGQSRVDALHPAASWSLLDPVPMTPFILEDLHCWCGQVSSSRTLNATSRHAQFCTLHHSGKRRYSAVVWSHRHRRTSPG